MQSGFKDRMKDIAVIDTEIVKKAKTGEQEWTDVKLDEERTRPVSSLHNVIFISFCIVLILWSLLLVCYFKTAFSL